MGFIRTLLFLIVIYYLVKIVMRYVLPFLFGNYMNRKMNEFSKQHNPQQTRAQGHRKEGEVTIDTNAYREDKKRKNRGDYVEYEEIKD